MNGVIPMDQNDPIKKNMSIFNPTDMAAMKESGEFNNPESVTVRDILGKFGIDVDGPATQLVSFLKKQAENANILKKMENISGQGKPPAMPNENVENIPPPNESMVEGLLR